MFFRMKKSKKNTNFIPHGIVNAKDKVLIVSDLHIGLTSNKKFYNKLIQKIYEQSFLYEHVILNGDVFETWKYGFIRWSIKSRAKKINHILKEYPGLEELLTKSNVHYIAGNHDFSVRWALGLPFKTFESIYIPEFDTHIEHGNNGDPRFSNKRLMRSGGFRNHIMDWLWDNFSGMLSTGMIISKIKFELFMARIIFAATGMNQRYVNYGFELLDSLNVSCVVLGHTHMHEVIERKDGKIYANSGQSLDGIQGIEVAKDNVKRVRFKLSK